MWKRIFSLDRVGGSQDLLKSGKGEGGGSKPPYTCLPPLSYDWIFRGSTLSTTEEAMPPLVRSEDSSEARLMAEQPPQDVKSKLKCVLVGDGAVGKTSLVVSYTTNGYPTEYVPTAFDNYNVIVNVDSQPIRLQLCDTAGQDDFDNLRPLCYPGCDVFLVCFSVVSPTSFHNVRDKWLPELRLHNPSVPILLVGTQCDLRTDVKVLIELAQYREQPVSEISAWKLSQQVDAIGYVESSALTQKNLKEVFDQAIVAALEARSPHNRKSSKRGSGRKHEVHARTFARPEEAADIIDYADEEERKSGWRRLCCLS